MQIYGPYRVSTTQPTSQTQRAQPPKSQPTAAKPPENQVDQLDLSSDAASVSRATQIAGGGEIRIDRVAEIRRQISEGSYETPDKLEAALDRMLDQFA